MRVRNVLLILMVIVCLATLAGCKGQVAQLPETEPSETEKQEVTMQEPYFIGKVLEKFDESCLMEVTEAGSGLVAVGQEVVVHINTTDCPDFAAGDILAVSFDGKMTCSLPPQVVGVAIIKDNG